MDTSCNRSMTETFPCYLFSVRIIQAQNIPSKDLLSASDCYVSLWLPSSSTMPALTKAIPNTSNPVWNESFDFLIQPEVKNMLELKLYDEDVVTKDDLLFTVVYDIVKIRPGDMVYESFILNSEGQTSLEVEFKMGSIFRQVIKPIDTTSFRGAICECTIANYSQFKTPRIPVHEFNKPFCISKAREVSCLEVQMDRWRNEECLKKYKNIVLSVMESFEEAQKITLDSEIFQFHCVKSWEPMLIVNRKSNYLGGKLFGDTAVGCPGVSLKSLPEGKETKVSLPLTKNEHLKLQLKINNCLGALDVRLGCDLCRAEQYFLHKRKNVVATALKKVLQLDQELQGHEVPVLAVMATGGGVRAMSAFYGHLFALQKLNLLDCVTYITGASGSTWTMRNLYEDSNWSQKDLVGLIHKARKSITRSKSNAFSMDAIKHYDMELQQRVQEGHSVSFTDLWSLIIDRMFHEELKDSKLSNQRQAVSMGQNPLPIYVALNVKENSQSSFEFKEWCEFSPYEVGFPKYGGFIPSEDFGSKFFMGRLMKKIPESKICFLEGVWSNIFSLNLMDVWNAAQSSYLPWQLPNSGKEKDENKDNSPFENQLSELKTICFPPPNDFSSILNRVLTHRPIEESTPNFLRGLQLHKDYYQHKTFSAWQETKLDKFPNHLTPVEKELCLVDAGYFINTSCPPLLRKERNVDVILSFDYNLVDTRFHSIENTSKCCMEKKIPFPKIVLSEEDKKNPKECYVFMDKENPEVPIVLHFPLVDNSFRKYKIPGIKRSSGEKEKGEMDLTSSKSPYRMTNLTYTEDEFDKLLNLCNYNIQNNSELILQALQTAIERRKDIKKESQPQSTSSCRERFRDS